MSFLKGGGGLENFGSETKGGKVLKGGFIQKGVVAGSWVISHDLTPDLRCGLGRWQVFLGHMVLCQ